MSYQRFSLGAKVLFKNTEYFVSDCSNTNLTLMSEADDSTFCRPVNYFVDALFKGELEFIAQTRVKRKNEISSIPLPEEQRIDLSDYPENLIEIARFRMKVITPLISRTTNRTESDFKERNEELKNEARSRKQNISARTIYRWVADFEKSGGDFRSLIPNLKRRGGPKKSRMPQEVQNIIDTTIKTATNSREKITLRSMYYLVCSNIEKENQYRTLISERLPIPSEATVARRIDALDIKTRIVGKFGKKVGGRMVKQVGKTTYPENPLDRVQFDHTKLDLMVVDELDNLPYGRCTLSFCNDMATRYHLGYYLGFEPPSYYTVMECLYHVICPKPDVKKIYGTQNDWIAYGIPNTLVVDQGKELIGKDLTDACLELGIAIDTAPVKTPEFKGGIERNFRTINTGLIHQLSGTTFSNFLEKGDYDSQKNAFITLNELETVLNRFIVDEYCERYHRGLDGIPARRWEAALNTNFFPRLPANLETLKILLGRVEYRTVQRYGIEFVGLRYNCSDLAYLRLKKHGEKIKIKYHPGDLSCIYAFDEFEKRYIEVPALDQEYTDNLSLWKHRVIRSFRKKYGDKENLPSLWRARKEINEIVERSKAQKRISSRSKIARYQSTPALKPQVNDVQNSKPKRSNSTGQKPNPKPIILDSDKLSTGGWEIADGKDLK